MQSNQQTKYNIRLSRVIIHKKMRPVATVVACSVVCTSVRVYGTLVGPAKTDEPIEMLLGGVDSEPCIRLVPPGERD